MPLGNDYSAQRCSLARTLEIVGERWTLLIVRDAFYGVRRFGDFALRLEIPRAVLAGRLRTLVGAGVLARVPGAGGHDEYELTEKGTDLWPALRSLMSWGDAHCSDRGPLRVFRHAADDGAVDAEGRCAACGATPVAGDLIAYPGPGYVARPPSDEPAIAAFASPRRLLEPIRPA